MAAWSVHSFLLRRTEYSNFMSHEVTVFSLVNIFLARSTLFPPACGCRHDQGGVDVDPQECQIQREISQD